jgi:hypothetical protein
LGQAVGGLVWCDFREFTPIPGLNQIFGHTPGNLGTTKRGQASINICLDTCGRVAGVRHYLVIDGHTGDRQIEIKNIDGTLARTVVV